MNIFNRNRIGRLICCELVHADNGDKVTGYITWIHAMVGGLANRVQITNRGHLPGPWIVTKVDVPMFADQAG